MKKVLIFENQKNDIENTLKYINLRYYKKELDYTYLVASQDLSEIANLEDYELIIIDIDLALRSEKDGIGIIRDIAGYDKKYLDKVFVLTGSPEVRDRLDKNGFKNIRISLKPTNFKELYKEMRKILL